MTNGMGAITNADIHQVEFGGLPGSCIYLCIICRCRPALKADPKSLPNIEKSFADIANKYKGKTAQIKGVNYKDRRRTLRRNQTEAERVLWKHLRNRGLHGLKFFRQYSVGPFIVDFYCPMLKLAIELDGGQHAEKETQEYDEERSDYLISVGIEVMRFWNNDVMGNIEGVLEKIAERFNPSQPPL